MKYILLASLFLTGCNIISSSEATVGECYFHREQDIVAKVNVINQYSNKDYTVVLYDTVSSDGVIESNSRPNNDEEYANGYRNEGFRFKYPKYINCSEFENRKTQIQIKKLKNEIKLLDFTNKYIIKKLELLEEDLRNGYKSGRK